MSFGQIADQRLLSTARSRLGELTWDVEPDGDVRRSVDSDVPFDYLMQLMARRSLDPALVTPLLDQFADRPIERALIAYDVARGALLGSNDGELVQRVATDIAPLRQLGRASTVAVPRDRVGGLLEAARAHAVGASEIPSLASIAAIERDANVDAIVAYAKQLACAHLPSLALAVLQIAWERGGSQAAFDLMIEVAVENDMLDAPPFMTGTDDRSVVQQTCVLLRTCNRQYDTHNARAYLEQLGKHPAVQSSTDAALTLARAELEILDGKPVDATARAVIEAHGQYKARRAAAAWRYGVFVHDASLMRTGRGKPTATLAQHIWTFGNDARLWGHAAYCEEARAELLAELSREVRYASHDPHVWRAVSILVTDGEPIDGEIDLRLAKQLATAFE